VSGERWEVRGMLVKHPTIRVKKETDEVSSYLSPLISYL
jgi:hypothetical protein